MLKWMRKIEEMVFLLGRQLLELVSRFNYLDEVSD